MNHPLSNSLPGKEDFLIDLSNNNYSGETIYNYGRDLSFFEKFLELEGISFKKISKRTISLYKGFLRSGRHLQILTTAKDTKESGSLKKKQIVEERNNLARSKGSKINEIYQSSRTIHQNEAYLNQLSSRSINRMLSTLRTYLKFLIEFDHFCPIPPESIKLIKTERKEPQVADLDELVKIIEAPYEFEKDEFIKLRNCAMLELLFSTGMRISELVNLNIDQINREGKIFIMGKGKKQRLVYLTHRARGHLNRYLEIRKKYDSPALFISVRGKNDRKNRITARYVQMKIQRYRQLLGIVVPVTPHGLRHGFATYLAEEGANPAAIQHLLGHESLQTTTRYVHASDKFAEETHKKYHPLAVE